MSSKTTNIIINKIGNEGDEDDDNNMNTNSNYSKLITNISKLKQQQINRNNLTSNQNIYETLKDLTCVSTNLNQTNITSITQNNIEPIIPDLKVSVKAPGSKTKKRESRFKVTSDQIIVGKVLIEGTFGRVHEGTLIKKVSEDDKQQSGGSATDANENENVVRVFIKTVNDLASTKQADLMVSEASLLKYVKHKHVNSLLGICVEPDKSPLAVFSFCENGNLKNYLKSLQVKDFKAQVNLLFN